MMMPVVRSRNGDYRSMFEIRDLPGLTKNASLFRSWGNDDCIEDSVWEARAKSLRSFADRNQATLKKLKERYKP